MRGSLSLESRHVFRFTDRSSQVGMALSRCPGGACLCGEVVPLMPLEGQQASECSRPPT